MSDKTLLNDIETERKRKPIAYWGLQISIISILYGLFILTVDGYLIEHMEPYLRFLPEQLIGGWLVIAGLIKLLGVLAHNGFLKRVGILLLSFIWSGVFVLAVTYSFGSGYPHVSYIFMGGMLASCFRVSLKGDFH